MPSGNTGSARWMPEEPLMTDDQWNRFERLIAESRREAQEHREESRKRFAETDKRYEDSRAEWNQRHEESRAEWNKRHEESRAEWIQRHEESRAEMAKRHAEWNQRHEESRAETAKRSDELHAKIDDGLQGNRVLLENLERNVQVLAEHQIATNDGLGRVEERLTGLEHRVEGIDLRVIRIEAHLENGAKRSPTKRPRATAKPTRKKRR
ncbi:MAG: hypothetical protein H0V17_11210 [Deltaproteobacteria bacterium]|nr:hypothetical protein [Deltaproteobacteria bacterium]